MRGTVNESLAQKVQVWIKNHRGVSITTFFGLLFFLFSGTTEISAPVVIMMETILLVVLFFGLLIFVYNFGYIAIILAVDEGLNDEEKILLKWMLRRAVIISVLWFLGVITFLMVFQNNPYFLASSNCFLLAIILYFIRKGENPLVEGTSI
ncbi:MAG: hypothetical protein ACXADY_12885 [Candidatus Hodarchaeales archaeon]